MKIQPFRLICLLSLKHINDEQKYTFSGQPMYNPDRDWENLIERSKEQPIQLSLFK